MSAAGQSADLRERAERRGLELRTARGRERIEQRLAMRLRGLAGLAEALRRGARTSLRESSSSGRIASAFSADACAAKTTARTAARMFGSGSLAYLSTAATCGFACGPSRAKN